MSETALNPALPETASIMNFYRKYLLLYPEAGRFADLPFIEPQERIKVMLVAASDAIERSDLLKQAALDCGLKQHIGTYWGRVKSGELVLPQALRKNAFSPAQRGG